MKFQIIDKETGKEPSEHVIYDIARKGNLMQMDIDQFAVCEDGQIILIDDCGSIAYCDMNRFEAKEIDNKTNNEVMNFPKTFKEFEEYYGFTDTEEVYTNGSRLIPVFRVEQWLEHIKEIKE